MILRLCKYQPSKLVRSFALIPKLPENLFKRSAKKVAKETKEDISETWSNIINLCAPPNSKRNPWYKLFEQPEETVSINRALKNGVSPELCVLINEKSMQFSEIQCARAAKILGDAVMQYPKTFDSMWDQMTTVSVESSKALTNSGIHFIVFETVLRISMTFLVCPKRAANAAIILTRMYPFVMHYFHMCPLSKQVICARAYQEVNLYDPVLFSKLLSTLKEMSTTLKQNPGQLMYFFADEFSQTELTVPLIEVLNYAYTQEKLCQQIDFAGKSRSRLPLLHSPVQNLLHKHICSTSRIQSLTIDKLLEEAGKLNYPEVFNSKEHTMVAEAMVKELLARDVLENEYCYDFVKVFIKLQEHLDKATVKKVAKKAAFEISMRLACDFFQANSRNKGPSYSTAFKLTEAAFSLFNILQQNQVDTTKVSSVILKSLSLLWKRLNNSVKQPQDYNGNRNEYIEIKEEAFERVLALELCCLTSKVLTSMEEDAKLNVKLCKELMEEVEINAGDAGEILCDEVYNCVEYFNKLKKDGSEDLNTQPTYVAYEYCFEPQVRNEEELQREKIFLGKDNIQITQEEYEKIIREQPAPKSIFGYDVQSILVGKMDKYSTTRNAEDMFKVLENLFSLCTVIKKFNLECETALGESISKLLESINGIEKGVKIFHVLARIYPKYMQVLRNGMGKIPKLEPNATEIKNQIMFPILKMTEEKASSATADAVKLSSDLGSI